MPKELVRNLTYYDHILLTKTSTATVSKQFMSNSCFDPDYTGVGHQPIGFDQYALHYYNYQVLGAVIKVRLGDANNAYPIQIGIANTSGALGATPGATNLIENGNVITKLMGNGTQGGTPVELTMRIDHPKWHGVSLEAYKALDNTYALFGSSPTDGMYFNIFAQSTYDSDVSTDNLFGDIQITYKVRFFEPKEVVGS